MPFVKWIFIIAVILVLLLTVILDFCNSYSLPSDNEEQRSKEQYRTGRSLFVEIGR